MSMRRLLLVAAGAVAVVTAVLAGSVAPAAALSCASGEDESPESIAAGREELATEDGFFATWHHLLLGRVVGVATDERELSPTRGHTRWEVEVAAALGEGTVPAVVEVTARDPGWLNGHAFTVGEAYAIPVWEIDDLGYWSSFTCDPITPLDDLDGAVEEVTAIARAHGTPVTPVVSGPSPVVAGDHPDAGWTRRDGGRTAGGPVAASAVLAVALAGSGTFAAWRRHQASPAPS